MLKRYAGAVSAGVLVTGALILWMQALISDGEISVTAARSVHVPVRIGSIPPPPKPRNPRDRIEQPAAPPELPQVSTQTRTDPYPARNSIGFPVPPSPPALTGRQGLTGGDSGPFGRGTFSDLLPNFAATPLYPHAAEMRGLEGRVTVEFTVTSKGTVENIQVIESSDRVFEQAAIDAVARSRYQPRIIDGTPVTVSGVRKMFEFQLQDRK